MSPLSHDEFFTKLADLFTTTKSNLKGSIFLTQKRLSYNPSESQTPSPTSDDPLTAVFPDLTTTLAPAPILIRATNGKSKAARKRGKKVKLSTVVQPDELEAFYGRYAEEPYLGDTPANCFAGGLAGGLGDGLLDQTIWCVPLHLQGLLPFYEVFHLTEQDLHRVHEREQRLHESESTGMQRTWKACVTAAAMFTMLIDDI
ncbi:uncharacterized protein CTHT_0048610 [Thermochaetoides thermophila DSM 1495]|uniref:Uncharacterized protein n=1 Tax=Chaetomium thermophilum (strain DSM 1495 / CBS 144.50 / IMI 039719) TaxID=759272 RepID=G0SB22_CHATD|nr:hypothetical protein CTHT_0048610 [Thermochaetoides thermophila DSM 1495]EGS19402.1 hypothetical protein CTHT_0048610 [Thermochaetoides thermophila DSM 1495]